MNGLVGLQFKWVIGPRGAGRDLGQLKNSGVVSKAILLAKSNNTLRERLITLWQPNVKIWRGDKNLSLTMTSSDDDNCAGDGGCDYDGRW